VPRRDDLKISLKDECFELMDGLPGSSSSRTFNEFLAIPSMVREEKAGSQPLCSLDLNRHMLILNGDDFYNTRQLEFGKHKTKIKWADIYINV